MAKTKTPFLSLGAHGSVGESITAQKHVGQTMLREKPLPSDPYSLPQAYQRWLYQDYAYLWTQQTEATRRAYAAIGSHYHLTGFQVWMRAYLRTLPDIAGLWHLDEKAGATAIDFSRNANNGIIVGASPAVGLIDGCFSFDGINDLVTIPLAPSLIDFTALTTEFFFKPTAFTGTERHLYYASRFHPTGGFCVRLEPNTNQVTIFISNSVGAGVWERWPFTPDQWYHIAFSWDGTTVHYYLDGIDSGAPDALAGIVTCSSVPHTFSMRPAAYWCACHLDHIITYRRALDATEIMRHSLRRYPPR